MKDLKQYMIESQSYNSSSLKESLLDDEDDLASNYEGIIRNFIYNNYKWILPQDSDITIRYDKKDGYIVDSKRSMEFINRKSKTLTNGLFRWGKVKDFNCSFCNDLESLEGAPEECRNFTCSFCKNLITLKGAPQKKVYTFTCEGCETLKDLIGSPKKCSFFNCGRCIGLRSLKGAPQECEEFSCRRCEILNDLNDAPKKCKEFDCRNCPNLNINKFSNILNKYDKVLKGTWYGI